LNNGPGPPVGPHTNDAAAERQIKVSGSGVVIDARQRLIPASSHVIAYADEIIVALPDGLELPAN